MTCISFWSISSTASYLRSAQHSPFLRARFGSVRHSPFRWAFTPSHCQSHPSIHRFSFEETMYSCSWARIIMALSQPHAYVSLFFLSRQNSSNRHCKKQITLLFNVWLSFVHVIWLISFFTLNALPILFKTNTTDILINRNSRAFPIWVFIVD